MLKMLVKMLAYIEKLQEITGKAAKDMAKRREKKKIASHVLRYFSFNIHI